MKIPLPVPISSVAPELEEGALTSVYGGPGTGKTCLCLLAAIECAKGGGKVAYVDTENGFSVERAKQLLDGRPGAEHLRLEQFLKKVDVLQPKTFDEQARMIEALKGKGYGLVVVDSLVALYRLEYSNQDEVLAASRKLSKQLSSLAGLARDEKIPVILTAHTYKNWETRADEMVGGEVLKYWSKAILFLERTGRMS